MGEVRRPYIEDEGRRDERGGGEPDLRQTVLLSRQARAFYENQMVAYVIVSLDESLNTTYPSIRETVVATDRLSRFEAFILK